MSDKLVISKIDDVYIRIRCDPGIAYELSERFTFTVPGAKFSPKFRNKVWDGKIRLYNVMSGQLYSGLISYVEEFAQYNDYEIEYADDFSDFNFSVAQAKEFISHLKLPDNFDVRDYQLEAFLHAIRKRRSLLLSPTASGKSLIIYLLTRFYNAKTLIIVPTTSLVSQLASDFSDYGYEDSGCIHRISAGADKLTNRQITISTWQSIYKMDKRYFEQFDMVIGDEAHTFKAKSLISIMSKLTSCKFKFGFTGTLDGSQTNKLVLEGLFGKVFKVTTSAELIKLKHLADFKIKAIVLSYPEHIRKDIIKKTYHEEIDYIVRNPQRNKFIKNLALSLEGNTLILFQYVEKHGDELYKLIKDSAGSTRNVYYVAGKTGTDEREYIRKIVETETNAIIVASSGTFSTGINIKNLKNVIFSSPSKARIKNLQSIGRVLRKSATKFSAELFDIADDFSWKSKTNYTLEHFKERLKIYSEEDFPFKIYNVGINS